MLIYYIWKFLFTAYVEELVEQALKRCYTIVTTSEIKLFIIVLLNFNIFTYLKLKKKTDS